ncbi:PLP-dependent aminotransferase family protein [Mesorhizobium sp. M0757]|uniref:MocR-like ectoine utilization transcription factor EhuR n=1 Tax=unclassified Mesorhizobium TaxID=325217 RepID=UPI00333D97A1
MFRLIRTGAPWLTLSFASQVIRGAVVMSIVVLDHCNIRRKGASMRWTWKPVLSSPEGAKYRAIADAIAAAINSGELRPGERLPPQRDLSFRMEVSVQTVFQAYAELERRGLVSGEVGRGTYVRYANLDKVPGSIVDKREEDFLDFSTIAPIVGEAHVQALRDMLAVLSKSRGLEPLLSNRPIVGLHHHRSLGADWLKALGLKASSETILITNGCQHGLWVALASLTEPGDVVASDHLVDSSVITSSTILKLQLRGLASDSSGVLPDAFAALCSRERVKVLCLTPTLNNPTASFMDEVRRRAIAEIARKFNVWIIEDDVFGPLVEKGPPPIAAFAPERTCYATSFSKSVMHSLRTGYLLVPEDLVSRAVSRLRTTGWMSNSFGAEISCRWLSDGTTAELIAWQRQKLGQRHKILERALKDFQKNTNSTSLHVWLSLPGLWRTGPFIEEARRRGVLITGPDPFIVGREADPHAVRLTIGDSVREDDDFKRGIETLAQLLSSDAGSCLPHI